MDGYRSGILIPDAGLSRTVEGRCRMYWHECEKCGARLDPGERCDCEEETKREEESKKIFYKKETGSDQFTFNWPLERLKV